jgi:hypothetical protein
MSIDEEENFDKIQHPFKIKYLMNLGVEGMYLNKIYDKPLVNIIFKGEKLVL